MAAVSPKGDVAALQRKIALLEKTIDKMNGDLKSLMSCANQTTASLSHYRDQIQEIDRKLGEVSKLRIALSQMSKTYSAPEPVAESTYRVKSGDTLEKIARKYQITSDALKKSNQLISDKIVIGQELTIPQ
jgi:peptidoglycan DL-endopeptidase LytE